MLGFGKKQTAQPAQSRQQRRAKDVREADRAGDAAINARPENRSTTPGPGPIPRRWWLSS
ncbi:hypothetical protein [Kitasatospora sp. NPDC059599]|uniref:hypothetical protein n=1 Tax=Kitasatospora sp. NPDC059599 TaxID=3346880 RepID=UPI0036AE8227